MEEIFRSILVLTIILFFIYVFLFEIVIMAGIFLFLTTIALIAIKGNVFLAAMCLVLSAFCMMIDVAGDIDPKRQIGTNYDGLFMKLGIPIIVICFYSFGFHRVI